MWYPLSALILLEQLMVRRNDQHVFGLGKQEFLSVEEFWLTEAAIIKIRTRLLLPEVAEFNSNVEISRALL
jgi:tRNA U34 5-methylaminomethyl-2-thiouridine-forming methyltransferase MnmC